MIKSWPIFWTLFLGSLASAPADQLLPMGSFEVPRVKARTPMSKGGNPALFLGQENWASFFHPKSKEGEGTIEAGLTNEIAHTGRQSIYIEFNKFESANLGVTLSSQLISIRPNKPYHVGIWGRLNEKNPLTLDQRLPYLRLLIEFYLADKENQTGSPIFQAQPLPDNPVRLAKKAPLFTIGQWGEYAADVNTPEDAAYIKVTWKWESTRQKGSTSGVIYFDDAVIEGEPGPTPVPEPEPIPDPVPAPPKN